MADHVLERLKDELHRRYGDRLVRIVLYGSRARGDYHSESDYDIAVVLKDYDGGSSEFISLSDLSTDLFDETGELISMVPFKPEDLEQRTLFMHNLRTEGVPV